MSVILFLNSVNCSLLNCTIYHVNYEENYRQNFFRWYFLESSRTVHFSIALLITLLTYKITNIMKSHQWYLAVLKKFWLNWNFKLNITNKITDEKIKNINIYFSSVKPLVKYLNKKTWIPHFTTDHFFFLCKKLKLPFLPFSSLLNSFSSLPRSYMFSHLLFFSLLSFFF